MSEKRPRLALLLDISGMWEGVDDEVMRGLVNDPHEMLAHEFVAMLNDERARNGGWGGTIALINAVWAFDDDAEAAAQQLSGKAFVNYLQALYRAERAKVELLEAEIAMREQEAQEVAASGTPEGGAT